MATDRPSWKEIDRMRDGSSKRRKRSEKDGKVLREHSTRYDKYKDDLNRLFDQGLAGELLKTQDRKDAKSDKARAEAEKKTQKAKDSKDSKDSKTSRRKGRGRIPKDSSKSASRFKLIRAVIDAQDSKALLVALDELVEAFGLPDDWVVLVRVLEHPDEDLIRRAVVRMTELLATTAKVPRRASLKERLRTINQTAADSELRQLAEELEAKI
jgi:hypothetical protein